MGQSILRLLLYLKQQNCRFDMIMKIYTAILIGFQSIKIVTWFIIANL